MFRAAAGVELQMEAAFLFDNVADEEVDPVNGVSPAEELALAITLLSCGTAASCDAARQHEQFGAGLDIVLQGQVNCIDSAGGQLMDAALEKRGSATPGEAMEMTSLKAGRLGRLAAGQGARMATSDPIVVGECEEFASDLFTYAQLVDDLRDARTTEGQNSDLLSGNSPYQAVWTQATHHLRREPW
jgi:geranylgeranyl pyrophosphate synthase